MSGWRPGNPPLAAQSLVPAPPFLITLHGLREFLLLWNAGRRVTAFFALPVVFDRLIAVVPRLASGHDASQRAGRIPPKSKPSR